MFKRIVPVLICAVLIMGCTSLAYAQDLGGFAQMTVVDKHDKPISGVTVSIVKDGNTVFKSTTGPAGVVQWSKKKVPEGKYIIRIKKGDYAFAAGLDMEYKKVGWVMFTHRINR